MTNSQPLDKEVERAFEPPPLPEPEKADRPKKPTEDELGDALIAQWGGLRRFFYGAWHQYEGGVWRVLDEEHQIDFWEIQKAHKKDGIKPGSNRVSSLERYCRAYTAMKKEAIDAGDNYINLQNGVYNLTTEAIEPHRPELYMTSQLPFTYDPDTTDIHTPHWSKFIYSTLVKPNGDPDMELIILVQQAMYYTLTADTSHRVSFWLVGPSGSGKSTLTNVMIALSGDSHVAIDLDKLNENQYQIADIAGKRLVTFSEPDTRSVLADGWYKRLVSKDVITARQAYGKPFNFVPKCKLWGSMNFTPRVLDRSDAVFNRVVIIPMNHVTPDSQQDLYLDDKLAAELPGIFAWALEGRKQFEKYGGFIRAKQSEVARTEFKRENDLEAMFIEDCCVRDPQVRISNDELRSAYVQWCLKNGYQPKGDVQLGKEWKRLGFTKYKSGSVRGWEGLRLIGEKINLSNF